jgi:hypothetical protein
MSEVSEHLPVNIREITQVQHIVLRLEQIQRTVVRQPAKFHELDTDRGLNHIRSEVKQLQSRLTAAASREVRFELKVLNEATDLLSNWEEEKELADVIVSDRHTREMLVLRNSDDLDYPALCALAADIREIRLKMFNKYKGYFAGLLKDNEDKRTLVDRQLQQTQPKLKEYLEKSEQLQSIHGIVLNYHQQSMNALVGGLAMMLAIGYGGWWFWKWWGVFPCLLLGYLAFSNIAHHHTYLEGKHIETLYQFLTERYELKNIRPFFKYANKKEMDRPTCFDASRGEALARFLHKDVVLFQKAFSVQERRKEEFVNYLTYLDGRTAWVREQHERMERLEKMRKGDKLPTPTPRQRPPTAPPLPGTEPEMPSLATHLGLRPAAADTSSPEGNPSAPVLPAEKTVPAPPESVASEPEPVFASIPPLPIAPEPQPLPPAVPVPKPLKILRKAAGKGSPPPESVE